MKRRKGTVYTPDHWADWAVETYGIAESWISGARILDPGCGCGALTLAILRKALESGFVPGERDLSRLKCIDRDKLAVERLRHDSDLLGARLPPESTIVADYLFTNPKFEADIVFANPPWTTFADLEEADKAAYRDLFRDSDLVSDAKNLLLGGSRIDIAALFVTTALKRDCAPGAVCYFFLPASLHRGEGAHGPFRRLRDLGGRPFALAEYRELDGGADFPGAGTRRSFAVYRADEKQRWPVPWLSAEKDWSWKSQKARPVGEPGSPLLPLSVGKRPGKPPGIPVPEGTVPRQGANSCGASGAFLLERVADAGNGLLEVTGKDGERGILPREWVHPLLAGGNFDAERRKGPGPGTPERWIFLPYSESGRILAEKELEDSPEAEDWLRRHRKALVGRKGVLIRRSIADGYWWAMLGVGPYSFAPWKIAWESYGSRRFRPVLIESAKDGHWQGNQAMHATLSFADEDSARKALEAMRGPGMDAYLKALGGAGTKGWAQPGRIRRILVPA